MKEKDLFIFFICAGILTSVLLFVGWRAESETGVYGDSCPISNEGRYYAKIYACNKEVSYASVPDGYCFSHLINGLCNNQVTGKWRIRDVSHSMMLSSGYYVKKSPDWVTPLRSFTFLLGCSVMLYFSYLMSK